MTEQGTPEAGGARLARDEHAGARLARDEETLESEPAPQPGPQVTRDVTFPTAFRGYDRAAVDAYVIEVNALIAELEATRSPEAAIKRALERVGEETGAIVERARAAAEEITARSRAKADDRLDEAEREAQTIHAEAEARLQAARYEAQAIRADAEARVRELESETEAALLERSRLVADLRVLSRDVAEVAERAERRYSTAPEATGRSRTQIEPPRPDDGNHGPVERLEPSAG